MEINRWPGVGRQLVSRKSLGEGVFRGRERRKNVRGRWSREDTEKRQFSLKKVAGRGQFTGSGGDLHQK